MPTHEIVRLGVAQSPEGRRIFPRMTVYENLQMGASILGEATAITAFARIWRWPSRCSRGWLSGGISEAARSRAASSRCWPSRAR